jgi:hypothetical protein
MMMSKNCQFHATAESRVPSHFVREPPGDPGPITRTAQRFEPTSDFRLSDRLTKHASQPSSD